MQDVMKKSGFRLNISKIEGRMNDANPLNLMRAATDLPGIQA